MRSRKVFYQTMTREGLVFEPIPGGFYDALSELVSEAYRDGYYGRKSSLEEAVGKIARYFYLEQTNEPKKE